MITQMLAISPQINADFSTGAANVADTPAKIISFGNLEVGWHYGEGGPIETRVIETALDIYWVLSSLRFEETDAFPGTYGEVMVTAYKDRHYVELIAERDGSVSVHYERDGDEVYSEERLPFDNAIGTLEKFFREMRAEEIWSSSDFYISSTSILTPIRTVSRAWLSETPMEPAFQLSEGDVLTMGTVQSVNMQGSFTLSTSEENRLYFGYLTNQYYLREAS